MRWLKNEEKCLKFEVRNIKACNVNINGILRVSADDFQEEILKVSR